MTIFITDGNQWNRLRCDTRYLLRKFTCISILFGCITMKCMIKEVLTKNKRNNNKRKVNIFLKEFDPIAYSSIPTLLVLK